MNKILRISAVFFLVASFRAYGSPTYVTEKGFTFTQVEDSKFGVAWRAPDGTLWSLYQGVSNNIGEVVGIDVASGKDGLVIDSPAVQLCEKIGGKLPTIEQYKVLVEYFLRSKDYHVLFPAPTPTPGLVILFNWSSSSPGGDVGARTVRTLPYLDAFGDVKYLNRVLMVQCVLN